MVQLTQLLAIALAQAAVSNAAALGLPGCLIEVLGGGQLWEKGICIDEGKVTRIGLNLPGRDPKSGPVSILIGVDHNCNFPLENSDLPGGGHGYWTLRNGGRCRR